jgi:hypothetical protein
MQKLQQLVPSSGTFRSAKPTDKFACDAKNNIHEPLTQPASLEMSITEVSVEKVSELMLVAAER